MFIGTSVGRRISRSTGLLNNPAEEGNPQGQCSITRASIDEFVSEETVDLGAFATEIYDLLPVEGTQAWPTAADCRYELADPMEQLAAMIPEGCAFILVDENQGDAGNVLPHRRRILFLERNGCYWGNPESDTAAISELERLRTTGASFIAFAWPAFWWLDYYNGFHDYLRSKFPCILQNERLRIFDLQL
jgi:hypothetical protein